MKAKKCYVIMSGSVDGAACEDDGFISCASFGLASRKVHKTLDEAIEVREQIIATDLEDLKTLWPEEDGYTIEVGSLSVDGKDADKYAKYIDVYRSGDVINETTYKIAEVEL